MKDQGRFAYGPEIGWNVQCVVVQIRFLLYCYLGTYLLYP